jgi:predicted glutamine amidotransferase
MATDSEAFFLVAVGLGLDEAPIVAMEQAVGRVEALAQEANYTPHMRFAACWSDGQKVYAARYASDRFAPSLFYQIRDDGIVISSEPLDENVESWSRVSPNTAIATDGRTMEHRDFRPSIPR